MSRYSKLILAAVLSLFLAIHGVLGVHPVLAEEKLTAEDVVQRHLDSMGSAATRAAAKSRVFEGATRFKVLTGGAGTLDGKTVIVSEGRKVQLMMKFPSSNYHGERLICDGNKVQVATSTDAQSRSNFGQFVYIQDIVMREGLLGGELSTAWPLLDLDHRRPKLSYEGLKTIDGKQFHDVRYKPQKSQDVEIHLYFDPATSHHVLTVYTLLIRPQLVQGSDAAQASSQQETHYRVEERFSEFRTADSLTLPSHYTIHFSQDQQSGNTAILEWDTTATRILENVTLDPRNFQVK